MTTLSLLRGLRSLEKARTIECAGVVGRISGHGLLGYFYTHGQSFAAELVGPIEKYVFERSLISSLLLDQCALIEKELSSRLAFPVVRLKGASLIGDIYKTVDERELTDIDLLVRPEDWKLAGRIIRGLGYSLVPQIVWSANRYKATFVKTLSCGVNSYVDLHSQILWRQSFDRIWDLVSRDGAYHLRADWQFAHLVGNFVFQDNFVTLKKLLDIDLWLKRSPHLSVGTETIELLTYLGLRSAWSWVKVALDILNHGRDRDVLSARFLDNPQGYPLRYFWIKNRTKDSWEAALSYAVERTWAYHLRRLCLGKALIGHDI